MLPIYLVLQSSEKPSCHRLSRPWVLHSTHMSMKFVAVKIFKMPIIVGILKCITCTNDIINSEEQVMPLFIKMKLLSYPYPLRPVLTSDLCIKIHTFASKVSNLMKFRQVRVQDAYEMEGKNVNKH